MQELLLPKRPARGDEYLDADNVKRLNGQEDEAGEEAALEDDEDDPDADLDI